MLGRLGFTLLTGDERLEGPPPPLKDPSLEPIDRLLRELVEQRVKNATAARKELSDLALQLGAAGRPTWRRWALALVALGAVAAAAGGYAVALREPSADDARLTEEEETALAEEETADAPDTPEVPAPLVPVEPVAVAPVDKPDSPPVRPPPRVVRRRPGPPPEAEALLAMMSKFERQLRRQTRDPDELDQALHMLNRQRARLTGTPTVADRRDVARQLAGWRRSYLHKR